jgi:hypothetical protein
VNTYRPSACPGGRAPHLWLADGRSLYDALGFEFTLLQISATADTTAFRNAADAMQMPLSILRLDNLPLESEEARDLYAADLALIRPDQIVAWRGSARADAANVLRRAAGHV